MTWLTAPLAFPFMVEAALIAVIVSVPAALLSCFLVLRGWALVLELLPKYDKHGRMRLGKVPGATEKLYKKHFLDLGGMGLRELRLHKADMLVLAGPTMDLDGTIAVYHWPRATDQAGRRPYRRGPLRRGHPGSDGPVAGQADPERRRRATGAALGLPRHRLRRRDRRHRPVADRRCRGRRSGQVQARPLIVPGGRP